MPEPYEEAWKKANGVNASDETRVVDKPITGSIRLRPVKEHAIPTDEDSCE